MALQLLRRFGMVSTSLVAAGAATLAMSGCSSSTPTLAQAGSGSGTVTIWAHDGQDSENAAIQAAVASFNSSQTKVHATLKLLPSDSYTSTVTSTPADKLPDVLEMDGPTLASYVYNEKLSPLTQYVSPSTVNNATAGSIAEGTYQGKLYALAMYDSGLGLYANKAMLDAAGVKYPTGVGDAWTAAQFTAVLQKLAAKSPQHKALDLQLSGGLGNEWGTYAFGPVLWSAGANLISGDKSTGVLNSPAAVSALTTFVSWKPYVDPNNDGNAFTAGRVALSWDGHWDYPTNSKALGSKLIVLPLPNFGNGPKTGQGSWTWGISSSTKNGKAAGAFLDFLLNDKNVSAMTTANGAPPATKSALAADTLYSSTGPLALFAQQLKQTCGTAPVSPSCVAVPRPVTPGYPAITNAFSTALAAAWGGAPVKTSLDTAAKTIDQSFSDNSNYK